MLITPRNILITGASSGIGAALANAYATEGVILNIVGRNLDRLEQVAGQCRAQGAIVEVSACDVSDRAEMDSVVRHADMHTPLDLIIANAGIGRNQEDPKFSREIVNTNILGVLNTVEPAQDVMVKRGQGQIAIMSSLAAYRALGGPPGYAASKAWARLYGEALRGRLAKSGVSVNVICPGFVLTPMTEKSGKEGMIAEDAAEIIKAALAANTARISFPANMAFRTWLTAALPSWLTDRPIRKKWQAARRV